MPSSLKAYRIIEVTPTLNTSAYAGGDRLGTIQDLTSAVRSTEADLSGSTLKNITIIDSAVQSVAIDLLFFDASPTVASADNAPISITDAELVDKCIGIVNIPAANYTTILAAGNSVAQVRNLDMVLKSSAASSSVYVVAVTRGGTPTYAADSLTFKYAIEY